MFRKPLAFLVVTNLFLGSLGCEVQTWSTSSTNPGDASDESSKPGDAGPSSQTVDASVLPPIRAQVDALEREHEELETIARSIQSGQVRSADIDRDELQKKVDAFTAGQAALAEAYEAASAQEGLSQEARIELRDTVGVIRSEVPGQIMSTLRHLAEVDEKLARAARPPESSDLQAIAVPGYAGIFAVAHPARFRFLYRDIDEGEAGPVSLVRPLAKGEAVLVLDVGDISSNVTVMAVDGNKGIVRSADLSSTPLPETAPHPLRPEWLLIERERPASDSKSLNGGFGREYVGGYWSVMGTDATGFRLEDAPFLAYADDSTPAVQEFARQRSEIVACYDAEIRRLDPDDKRKSYDRVTYRNGKPVKVERLTTVYDRKACKKCGCKAFNDRKRTLAGQVLAPMQKQRYEELRPDIDRLNELFGR